MDSYYIGLDNGGTSCKAVLFTQDGKEVCQKGRLLTMLTPHPLWTERDMDELWEKNVACIKDIIAESHIDPHLIKGLSCSGHGKGLYLWGKDNKPVRNGIVSTDGRAKDIVARWIKDGVDKKVFARNYQSLLASQPVSLLRWLKEEEKEKYDTIRWVFEVKDYIRFKLTGEAYAELTDYSGSNLYDLTNHGFQTELLSWFGIEDIIDCLPPLKKSCDVCGYVTEEIAHLTGLPVGIPVAGGMFDIDSCAIAMNIVDSSHLCCIAGTWSINEFITKEPIVNHTIMMNSLYCVEPYYLVEECSPTSAGNLEWYIHMFMEKEKEEAEKQGKNIYAYTDEMVASVTKDDDSLFFLPFIFGSNYNPSSKACFIGLDAHHTRSDMVKAVFEGIIFCHYIHIEKLLANKKDFTSIRLAGGAANSSVWTQMFSDILGYPIETVRIKELGALGVAMAAAVAAKAYPTLTDAAAHMTKKGTIVYPNEAKRVWYQAKFKKYKALYLDLEKFWT